MIERVRLTRHATKDMREARQWYDACRNKWGNVFLRRVRECMRAIQEMPRRFPPVHGEIRRAPVRQFPYGLIYGYSATEVTIYAVFHSARDPQKWMDRIEE